MTEKEHPCVSAAGQCELLQISRSGLYYGPVKESGENLSVLRLLDEQYLGTPFCGPERLYPRPRTGPAACRYPYLLRELPVERRSQVWATGITCLPMKRGFLYLCAITDVHTRYVAGA